MVSMKFVTIFLISRAVAAQVQSAAAPPRDNVGADGGIVSFLDAIINGVVRVVTRVVDLAQGIVDKYEKTPAGVTDDLARVVDSIVSLISNIVDEGVNVLGKDINANGLILHKCINSSRSALGAAVGDYPRILETCSRDVLQKNVALFTPLLTTVKNALGDVGALSPTLQKCADTDVNCIAGVFLQILNIASASADNVTSGWNNIQGTWLNTTQVGVKSCFLSSAPKFYSGVFNVYGNITACVKSA